MAETSFDAPFMDQGAGFAPLVGFPQRIRNLALQTLPGAAAQKRFEPHWGFGRHYGPPAHDAVPAAVLALLYPVDGRIVVPLTVRHGGLTAHAGQISFPGGHIDAGESDWDAAIRELNEELGVAATAVTPIAPLSPLFIFATNYLVRPWLAWTDRRPKFVPNPDEVEEVLEVPLDVLQNSQNWQRHRRFVRGIEQEIPYIAYGSHRIWGATAMILSEVLALTQNEPTTARADA